MMPPSQQPMWRRGVHAVDKVAAPVLEGAVRHDAFGLALSVAQQARRGVLKRTERASRRILHGLNLPTASDVNRLLTQIAAIENRLRQMDEQAVRIAGPAASKPRGQRTASARALSPNDHREP